MTRTAIHAIKADQVATFLGRKLRGNFAGEVGNRYSTRIEGTCIKHQMHGKAAIKMYDKFGHVLRIETTSNNISFFKHYRKVEHRDGTHTMKQAPLKKTIYSLGILRELMQASNRRYLEFISEIEDSSVGLKNVEKVTRKVRKSGRSYRGFNPLSEMDHQLFLAIARGEHTINGMTNKSIRQHSPGVTGSQMSRLLKNLRLHGLIKKVGRTYKYYLTPLGRQTILTALKLRDLVTIPSMTPQTTI